MNKNLYGLMNWPEIEGIVYAECDKPKELLGAHVTGKGLLIQIMRPDAVAVKLHIDGRKTAVNMEKVDEAGFFAALVSSKKSFHTLIQWRRLMERSQNIRTHMHLQMLRNRKITKHFLQEKRKMQHIYSALMKELSMA